MCKKSPSISTLIFLAFAFSIACTQAVMASTTAPTGSSKGSKVEASGEQGPVLQAITPGPVPADLIVSGGGLEWVYASPCVEGGCSNPSPTNQEGWRYATYEELTQQFPTCDAFVRPDNSNICASQYFDPTYTHCDMGDCRSGYVCSEPGELCANGQPTQGYFETFYVRGDAVPPTPALPVPVLSTLGVAMLILGLVLFARRRVKI